jgi:hypothetical protein
MNFFTFSDYTLNLAQVSDIDREDPKCWTVYLSSGRDYDLEGDDLKKFKAATGL